MPLLSRFEEILDGRFPFLRSAEVYLAISGGKDSMALSYLLLKTGIKHTLLHCNFQLRGKESEQDEEFLLNYAEKERLAIKVERFDTESYAALNGLSIQEAARNLRYEWFESFISDENSYLLTAHHLDDSIETFFINLMRGTGANGLNGIPEINGQIVRPLSDFTVDELITYISENNISYRQDSSNESTKYLRNRIRHHIIPEIMAAEPKFQSKMKSLFKEMRSVAKVIESDMAQFRETTFQADGNIVRIPVEKLQAVNERAWLYTLFSNYGIRPNNVSFLIQLIESDQSGKTLVTKSHVFARDRSDIIIGQQEDSSSVNIDVMMYPTTIELATGDLKFLRSSDSTLSGSEDHQKVDYSKITGPLTVRNWEQGDMIKPLGMSGTKLISDVLIDKKISVLDKQNVLVVADGSGSIVSAPGILLSEDFKLRSGSSDVLEIVFVKS